MESSNRISVASSVWGFKSMTSPRILVFTKFSLTNPHFEYFQRNSVDQAPVEPIQSAKFSMVNPPAHACHLTLALHSRAVAMNARVMENVVLRNIATIGSARKLVLNAEKERRVHAFPTTELFANARRVILDRLKANADQNATETSIALDQDQLATMEFARTLAMELAELVLIVISVV